MSTDTKTQSATSPAELMDFAIREIDESLKTLEKTYSRTIHNLTALRLSVKAATEMDELTHLLRRGTFLCRLERLLLDARARGEDVQVMMIDLDHFKIINDRFGHQAGDEVLERVGALLTQYLRPGDIAGRYGGEELIVAVECSEWDALDVAERLRSAVAQAAFTMAQNHQVTLSLGMASAATFGFDAQALIAAADRSLYDAKHNGRNRVACARPAEDAA
jgi:diguanylate cyclase (GGDEF)-like protein